MSAWVIPYVDQDLDFWEEIHERFGDHVREVYFPMPEGRFASGRSRQPEESLGGFLQHAPLPKAVLLNPVVLPHPVDRMAEGIVSALLRLWDDFGVHSVTVSDPGLALTIKRSLPGWHITGSVLMGVATPTQAWLIQDSVDALTVDSSLVRDLDGLRMLRSAFEGELRLIVNEACLPGCLFRTQHFYEMGYGEEFPESLCQQMLAERPWLRLTGAWILPQHLAHYDGLYDVAKLAGRVTLRERGRYLRVLGAYVDRLPILARDIGGGPASPLDPIEISDEWFQVVLRCDKQCYRCSICRDQYQHAQQVLGGER